MTPRYHLEYFRQLLQGEATVSFRAYWNEYQKNLEECLPRAQFLRLKFSPMEEMQSILESQNVSFRADARAIAREKYFFAFDSSALDEKGRLKAEFKRSLFSGAIGDFYDGQAHLASEKLNKYIGSPREIATASQVAKFQDLVYFADIELEYGDKALGTFLMDVIEKLSFEDDRLLELQRVAATSRRGH